MIMQLAIVNNDERKGLLYMLGVKEKEWRGFTMGFEKKIRLTSFCERKKPGLRDGFLKNNSKVDPQMP